MKAATSLAEKIERYIAEKKQFTLADLYREFGDAYQKHSIRARVYESGKVVRVGRGKYVLAGAEIEAIVEQGDAKELFQIKRANIYYDLIFLDPPYMTGGQRGGNRHLAHFPTMGPEEFAEIVRECEKMLRTEESQIYFMIAGGKSSLSTANKYIRIFSETSLKLAGEGSYTKLTKSGKVCNMGKYPMPPEKLMVFSPNGKLRECDDEVRLDFAFERPPLPKNSGYSTQKPLALLESIVKQATRAGEWVLDPFGGSGVTLEATLKNGRKAHIVELLESTVEKFILPKLQKFGETLRPAPKQLAFDFGAAA